MIGSGEKACYVWRVNCYIQVIGSGEKACYVWRVTCYIQVIGSGEKACYVWPVTCYIQVIGSGEKACYVWRIRATENALDPISLTFNVNFRPEDLDLPDLPCNYIFSIDHIQVGLLPKGSFQCVLADRAIVFMYSGICHGRTQSGPGKSVPT